VVFDYQTLILELPYYSDMKRRWDCLVSGTPDENHEHGFHARNAWWQYISPPIPCFFHADRIFCSSK